MDDVYCVIVCASPERAAFQKAQWGARPNVFYLEAYTPASIDRDYIRDHDPIYPEKDETMCCFKSHVAALRAYESNSDLPYCLVVEDDVVFRRDANTHIRRAIDLLEMHDCIDYVSMGYLPGPHGFNYNTEYTDGFLNWGKQEKHVWGAQAYLVPRRTVRAMLQIFDAPNTVILRERVCAAHKYNNRHPRIQTDALYPLLFRQAFTTPLLAIEYPFESMIESRSRYDERWGPSFQTGFVRAEDFYSPSVEG